MTTTKNTNIWIIVAGLGIFSVFAINRVLLSQSLNEADAVAAAIDVMPPTAAGTARSGAGLMSSLDGLETAGQVAAIYVTLGPKIYVSIDRAPVSLRKTAARFAVVEFAEPLSPEFDAVSVIVKSPDAAVAVGDVVSVKFVEGFSAVGRDNASRVTQVLAAHDSDESKVCARRIVARKNTASPVVVAETAGQKPALLSGNSVR